MYLMWVQTHHLAEIFHVLNILEQKSMHLFCFVSKEIFLLVICQNLSNNGELVHGARLNEHFIINNSPYSSCQILEHPDISKLQKQSRKIPFI